MKKIKLIIIPIVFLVCFAFTSLVLGKYSTTLPKTISLNISKIVNVAEVNSVFYSTLQEAIDAVPTDGTLTVVTLLSDTTEAVTVYEGQNISFNLQSFSVTAPTTPNNLAVMRIMVQSKYLMVR